MNLQQSTWGSAWGEDYGIACGGACIGAVISITAAVGSAGVTTAVSLKNAADRRQALRLIQLRRKRKAIKRRRASLQERTAQAETQIAESKQKIEAARAKARDRTPWVLYAGAAGLILVTFIAAKTAHRG